MKKDWYKDPTYNSWHSMKSRCDNPNYKQYQDYGGRGITYHPSWGKYSTFLQDMGERPTGTSLDRKDNEQGYTKENCKWSSRREQSLNKRQYKRKKSTLAGTRKRSNGKWIAQISVDKIKLHLGTFNTEQEAHERFVQERNKRIGVSEEANQGTTEDTQ